MPRKKAKGSILLSLQLIRELLASVNSHVIKLRNNYPVLRRIRFYAVPTDNIATKIKNLDEQENKLFCKIDDYNKFFGPRLLNKKPISNYEPRHDVWGEPIGGSIDEAFTLIQYITEIYSKLPLDVLDRLNVLCGERYGQLEANQNIIAYPRRLKPEARSCRR